MLPFFAYFKRWAHTRSGSPVTSPGAPSGLQIRILRVGRSQIFFSHILRLPPAQDTSGQRTNSVLGRFRRGPPVAILGRRCRCAWVRGRHPIKPPVTLQFNHLDARQSRAGEGGTLIRAGEENERTNERTKASCQFASSPHAIGERDMSDLVGVSESSRGRLSRPQEAPRLRDCETGLSSAPEKDVLGQLWLASASDDWLAVDEMKRAGSLASASDTFQTDSSPPQTAVHAVCCKHRRASASTEHLPNRPMSGITSPAVPSSCYIPDGADVDVHVATVDSIISTSHAKASTSHGLTDVSVSQAQPPRSAPCFANASPIVLHWCLCTVMLSSPTPRCLMAGLRPLLRRWSGGHAGNKRTSASLTGFWPWRADPRAGGRHDMQNGKTWRGSHSSCLVM